MTIKTVDDVHNAYSFVFRIICSPKKFLQKYNNIGVEFVIVNSSFRKNLTFRKSLTVNYKKKTQVCNNLKILRVLKTV